MQAFVFFYLSLQSRIYVILIINSMKNKVLHPEWALACKRKGTELRLLNGKYYLYQVTSKWNPEKKRSVKITEKFLGRITETEGFVESEKARLRRQQDRIERVQVKEYGIALAVEHLFTDTVSALKKFFPDSWQRLVALAYGRLVYQSPLKNMSFHYAHSYLSEQYSGVDLSARSLSYFLREIGEDRNKIVEFCRSFKISKDCILFDGIALPGKWNFPGSVKVNLVPLMIWSI